MIMNPEQNFNFVWEHSVKFQFHLCSFLNVNSGKTLTCFLIADSFRCKLHHSTSIKKGNEYSGYTVMREGHSSWWLVNQVYLINRNLLFTLLIPIKAVRVCLVFHMLILHFDLGFVEKIMTWYNVSCVAVPLMSHLTSCKARCFHFYYDTMLKTFELKEGTL